MNVENKKYPILSSISSPTELRLLSVKKLVILCKELRDFLLNSISRSSGHFASGFGVVELTVAIHYVYNTPYDKLIWDVGHQAYPHKILTGRRDRMLTIRKKNGLHPFPWREESEYDTLSVGHSSTSISAGVGISVAFKMENLKNHVVCVIGDGAMTSGIAFEAMNHIGSIQTDILIVLNDNEMSISNNIGAISKFLSSLNKENKNESIYFFKYKKNLFKDKEEFFIQNRKFIKLFFEKFGFSYIGPIDGHDLESLIKTLKKIKKKSGPKILHVKTKKGKGYLPAEKNPTLWHAVPRFNPEIGILSKCSTKSITYSSVFGDWLCDMASKDRKLMVITPAMCEGSGLLDFSKKYPNQYFDVSIAEQHAVTFAAGLAIGGYYPVVSIYSTFLQRAYDQVIHDVAIQNLSVLFAIDRAGIVGQDGQTHQGAFDLSFLRCIPNMIIMTPSNENECRLMLYTAYFHKNGPYAIRYPKSEVIGVKKIDTMFPLSLGKGVVYRYGKSGIAILNFGTLLVQVEKISEELDATLVDMRFVKPLDQSLINNLSKNHPFMITIEENSIIGGAGSGVNEYIMREKLPVFVLNIGFPDKFIPQGTQKEILSDLGLDSVSIKNTINSWICDNRKN